MFNYVKTSLIKNTQHPVLQFIGRVFMNRYQPPKLGRWALIHDDRVNRKVDWSNEDHCGPCGSLKLDKYTDKK